MEVQSHVTPFIIGYYPFRAKAQVLRLICEYLHMPYYDRFLNPVEWNHLKEVESKERVIKDIPFLHQADFIITGQNAMITYVVQLSKQTQLLGKNLPDKLKIDQFKARGLQETILGYICSARKISKHNTQKSKKEHFEKKICHLMTLCEKETKTDDFYLGYLTIIDFCIYEIFNYFRRLFPEKVSFFPNMAKLREKVAKIPQIHDYESSHRAVKEYCPIRYFDRFREEKLKANRISAERRRNIQNMAEPATE